MEYWGKAEGSMVQKAILHHSDTPSIQTYKNLLTLPGARDKRNKILNILEVIQINQQVIKKLENKL